MNLTNLVVNSRLESAGRFDGVIDVLSKIISNVPMTLCPVKPYYDGGTRVRHVAGQDVKEEALRLFFYLNCSEELEFDGLDFWNLYKYVEVNTDIVLHNFAVSVSHKQDVKFDDYIRNWCILENLLVNLDYEDWDVPEGWRVNE